MAHVTKEGQLSGPKVIEHLVDVVLYFDSYKRDQFRLLRNYKNRFGSTNEIGVFEMTKQGFVSVDKPSEIFLQERAEGEPGSVITSTLEGSRALLVEIQALLSWKKQRIPKQRTLGIEVNRVWMMGALLERKLGIALGERDLFVNVVGGIRLDDPAVDLCIVAALISSALKIPIESSCVMFGELGLAGEVRSVANAENRIRECLKMSIKKIYLPRGNYSQLMSSFIREAATETQLIAVKNLEDLIYKAFNIRSFRHFKQRLRTHRFQQKKQLIMERQKEAREENKLIEKEEFADSNYDEDLEDLFEEEEAEEEEEETVKADSGEHSLATVSKGNAQAEEEKPPSIFSKKNNNNSRDHIPRLSEIRLKEKVDQINSNEQPQMQKMQQEAIQAQEKEELEENSPEFKKLLAEKKREHFLRILKQNKKV